MSMTVTHTPTESPEEEPAPERSVWQYLWTGISGGILALVLGLAMLVVGLPAVIGGMPVTVLSGSMEPSYSPGDLVVVQDTAAEDVRVGEVLTYQLRSDDPTLVTHRVISREMSSQGGIQFITQGDTNSAPDAEPVGNHQVVGTVWYTIPKLGWVNQAISGPTRQWLIPAVAGLLFLYATWNISIGFRHRNRDRNGGPPAGQ